MIVKRLSLHQGKQGGKMHKSNIVAVECEEVRSSWRSRNSGESGEVGDDGEPSEPTTPRV